MSGQRRLRRLERLLALRQAAAERARQRFAQSVSDSTSAAERVARVGRLIAAVAPADRTTASIKAAAALRLMLREAETAARQALEQRIAQRVEAERVLALASARAERLAARTETERRAARRQEDVRLEHANPSQRARKPA